MCPLSSTELDFCPLIKKSSNRLDIVSVNNKAVFGIFVELLQFEKIICENNGENKWTT